MKLFIAIFAVILVAGLCSAQVVINQGSIAPIGMTFVSHSSMGNVDFNVGSSGANQTWTFGEYTFEYSGTAVYMNPAETTWGADFPTANRALSMEDGSSATYYRVASEAAYWLGTGTTAGVNVFDAEAMVMPFPCQMGSQWTLYMHYVIEVMPGFVVEYTDSVISVADGWGTIHTQFGSHQVLRVFGHTYTRIAFPELPPTESEYVGYIWYTASGVDLVSVISDDGVTDPNFSNGFLEMGEMAEAAEEPRGPVAENFRVEQNYPNPFNPSTTLPLDLARNAHVTIRVYDETGRLVLDNELDLPAGQHRLPINGSQWSTGTYFANVSAGADQQTVKMQLVK